MSKLIAGLFSIVLICGNAFAKEGLSGEQQGYCDYMKKSWNYSCKSIEKSRYQPEKERKIATGCEGPGLGCGALVYQYTRVNNSSCITGIDKIKYDELWAYSTKHSSNKVYWLKGKFVFESVVKKQYFRGFEVDKVRFDEAMGMSREQFQCEIGPYIGK